MRQPLFVRWRSLAAALLLLLVAFVGLAFFLSRQLFVWHVDRFGELVEHQAGVEREFLMAAWGPESAPLAEQIALWARLWEAEVLALSGEGDLLAAAPAAPSSADLRRIGMHLNAFRASDGGARAADADDPYRYWIIPLDVQDAGRGLLYVRRLAAEMEAPLVPLRRAIAAGSFLVALLAASLMVFRSERTARIVRQLTQTAERLTAGELDARVLTRAGGEVGLLARAFNQMAAALEDQILRTERERDRLTTIMHVMADGVIMVSRKGRVRLINPAATALVGVPEEEALKRSFVQLVRDHRIVDVWQRCQQSGTQEVAAIDLGPNRFLRVVVTPFLKGADRGYLIILQDLTLLRQLQTIRQDFISNISHELRTPLASLHALVDTLRDSALDDPPAALHFLSRMEVEVDSLTQMVQELLELSRIESGQVPFRLKTAPIEVALLPGVERLRPQAERAALTLTIAVEDDLPPVLMDPERVQQVVANLVHNAIKFTPAGGHILIRATADGEAITIHVADTGGGIPPDDLTRIFERFYKADRARSGGGTGLGLAIAKHIVQSHGGRIWAESTVGRGSVFHFTLPAAADGDPSQA